MQRYISDDEEPLEDKTAALSLHSKRTDRLQRKMAKRDKKRQNTVSLSSLPAELILEILESLRPSDVFCVSLVSRWLHELVQAHENAIGGAIIQRRYPILSRCFPLPVLLSSIEPWIHSLLNNPERQQKLNIHKNPYQHVRPSDSQLVCTCLTCILTWNNLALVLDFAHWRSNLDNGEPIPILPRGKTVPWNEELVDRNARIVRKALNGPLWHARILETHLESTVRSIWRHQKNKGNKRKHVTMTEEEAANQTDHFLEKEGPVTLEFPYNRDEYYMLEAYLPQRWWKKTEHRWFYIQDGLTWHKKDLEMVVRTAQRDRTEPAPAHWKAMGSERGITAPLNAQDSYTGLPQGSNSIFG